MKLLIVISLLFLVSVYGASLPPEITKCNVGDSVCVARSFTEVLNKHYNGLPSFSLPVFEPLHVNSLDIDEHGSGPLNIKLHFENLDFHGLKHSKVTKATGFIRDPSQSKFDILIVVPKFKIVADYEIKGSVLILPIHGKGKAHIDLDNFQLICKIYPKVTIKNGKKYISITEKFKMNVDADKMHINLENLFNGDRALSDNMNLFLNENWRDIFDEIRPAFSEAMKSVIRQYVNRIFKNVPYDDVWLD